MFVSTSLGFCRDGLLGAILFNAGFDMIAVVNVCSKVAFKKFVIGFGVNVRAKPCVPVCGPLQPLSNYVRVA